MSDEIRRGLIVGKFWPPHIGHLQLIDHLRDQCDKIFIVVCSTKLQTPSGARRALWIQAVVPEAEIIVVEDFCAFHHPNPCFPRCTAAWARRVEELNIGRIAIVASSESYGPSFAKEFGARHVTIDRFEGKGISSTAIREDLSGRWHDLPRAVRSGLFRKIVVLGAESTGTTTLAMDLGRHLNSPVAAEAGRTISWVLFAEQNNMESIVWTDKDFWEIVDHQIALEHRALGEFADLTPSRYGPWLVCDTDSLATIAWWERYAQTPVGDLSQFAKVRLADLYVLTSPEGVGFDDSDPLRDGKDVRAGMHERFRQLVKDSGRPWVEVVGSPEERVKLVLTAIEKHEIAFPRWVHH